MSVARQTESPVTVIAVMWLVGLYCRACAMGLAGPVKPGRDVTMITPQPCPASLSDEAAKLVHLIAWQGKVFDPDKGELRNEVTPFRVHAVRAKVYKAPSWLDGNESIVLDYSQTSLVAHWVRDEIREIGPGTYLGIVYWKRSKLIDFVLEFPAA